MKRYLVFSYNIAMPTCLEENPTGCKCDDFDDISDARAFADIEKQRWDRISINDQMENGTRKRIEKYENGRWYPG